MAVIIFDAESVGTVYIKDPLPAGDYTVTIVDSHISNTPQGNLCLVLDYEVVDDPYKGYKLYDRFIIVSKADISEDRARLATVCTSAGIRKLTDSNQLHGKQHKIRVILRKDGHGDIVNDIKGYLE